MGSPGVRRDRRRPAAAAGAVRAAGQPAGEVARRGARWERHIVEVETGLPPDAAPGAHAAAGVRPGDADAGRARRGQGRRADRRGQPVGARTCSGCAPATPEQGLWGLVDQRAVRAMGGHRTRRRAAGRRGPGGDRRRDEHLDWDPVAADPPGGQGGGGAPTGRAWCRCRAGPRSTS